MTDADPATPQGKVQGNAQRTVRRTVIVVGGGAAGLVAALGLSAAGASVTLIAPDRRPDPRTTALMDGSVNVLKTLGVWPRLEENAAALKVMRLIDGTRRLLRAPEVAFAAREMELDAFAWNVENLNLNAALDTAVTEAPIDRITAQLTHVVSRPDHVEVTLDDGRILHAALLAAADGRNSLVRRSLGIPVRARSYPQVAVTATLAHSRAHGDVSTEFHTETGPFTLVPLPGKRSSVVCVVDAAEAERLVGLDPEAFAGEMERRAHSILGSMRLESERGSFPLSAGTADRLSFGRVALLGEAAHVIPPIGAQGLNLGIRDGATLAELVADTLRADGDIGGAALAEAYERRRRADIETRSFAVDLFNRSLLTGIVPIHGLRGLALWLMQSTPSLRRAVMRQGIGPTRDVPRLVAGRPL
ncbi:MAG: UbiH/UbiF family hydroxylase [Xanthobacteraceae bacterium]|nr:UbiH/UbiF family hydroxylase [Xanthobacteraceae bacterium]